MPQAEVARLFRAAQEDPLLRTQLNSAESLAAFVELAAAAGYSFTIEEWQQATRFAVEELKCEVSEIPGL